MSITTLPHELTPLVLRNSRLLFDLLFDASSRTLLDIAKDPKHLGVEIGATAVLHTWGQNLLYHPHVHYVVTAGGLAPDQSKWISSRPDFFAPVRVLARLFRGKFLAMLRGEHAAGNLDLSGSTAHLADPSSWKRLVDGLYSKDWIVYAKPPFGGPEHVFRYLGRYTHRVAISNHRILEVDRGKVTFAYRDYVHGGGLRQMTLDAIEFLRRFLLHVLPRGFVRIRHYGLSASRNVPTKLALARRFLEGGAAGNTESMPSTSDPPGLESWWEQFRQRTGIDVMRCPRCENGRLVRSEVVPAISAVEPWHTQTWTRAG